MTPKEKAHHTAATVGWAGMETAAGQAVISCLHCTTGNTDRQDRLKISDVLPRDRKNALKMHDLKELFGEDSRTIRLMIQKERRCVPILSDNSSGYWISDDPSEVQEFSRSMKSRSKQIWRTASNVEKAAGLSKSAPQLDGQTDFWGGDGNV